MFSWYILDLIVVSHKSLCDLFLGWKGCWVCNKRTSYQPMLWQRLLFQLRHNVSLCHWEILTRNTLGSTIHHPELEIRLHQVPCQKHLQIESLGSLDCNAPGQIGDTNACLIRLKAFCQGLTQTQTLSLRNNWQRESLRSARWGINLPRWFTIPMDHCIPATSEGTGNWATAVVFFGSTWSPELSGTLRLSTTVGYNGQMSV